MAEEQGLTPDEQEKTQTGQTPEQASAQAADGGEHAKDGGQEPKTFDAAYVRELREEAKRVSGGVNAHIGHGEQFQRVGDGGGTISTVHSASRAYMLPSASVMCTPI